MPKSNEELEIENAKLRGENELLKKQITTVTDEKNHSISDKDLEIEKITKERDSLQAKLDKKDKEERESVIHSYLEVFPKEKEEDLAEFNNAVLKAKIEGYTEAKNEMEEKEQNHSTNGSRTSPPNQTGSGSTIKSRADEANAILDGKLR